MSVGKCIIASALDQLREVFEHNRTVWLVHPGDEVELATALQHLILDFGKRARLGKAAREEAIPKAFVVAAYTKDLLRIGHDHPGCGAYRYVKHS
jgi:glycosyltransferase involved in cell wall biosynthesis